MQERTQKQEALLSLLEQKAIRRTSVRKSCGT